MVHKVYIETTGCAINRFYSEVIAGQLINKGFKVVTDPTEADLVILNACSIKKPTEEKMLERVKSLSKITDNLIILGCLVNTSLNRLRRIAPKASFFDVKNFLKLSEYLDRLIQGNSVEVIDGDGRFPVPLLMPRQLENHLIAVVPIAKGCLGSCSYCVDKLIWGNLKSYPVGKIVEEVKRLVKMGVKEIRLSGQDTGPYGWDISTNLAELLDAISAIPGEFKVRIGMASPDTIVKVIDDVLDIISSDDRFYRYLHIPVQSGSDRILKLMRRKYTADLFRELVRDIRGKLGEKATIATDIISSFPTETDEDHKATIKLLLETQPDIVNLSRYGDRPGVPSSRIYPKVHSGVSKKRTRELAQIIRDISYKRNQRYLGRSLRVLILERRDSSFIGRTDNYRTVVIRNHNLSLGEFIDAKIIDVTWKTLYGTVVPN